MNLHEFLGNALAWICVFMIFIGGYMIHPGLAVLLSGLMLARVMMIWDEL